MNNWYFCHRHKTSEGSDASCPFSPFELSLWFFKATAAIFANLAIKDATHLLEHLKTILNQNEL